MKRKNKDNFCIISHFYKRTPGSGSSQDLMQYLIKRSRYLAYIDHPFGYNKIDNSRLTLYEYGDVILVKEVRSRYLNESFTYIFQLFVNYYFLLSIRGKSYTAICLDDLCFLSSFMLKPIGKLKNVIYYSIDYSKVRFKNRILDLIYKTADWLSLILSDKNWAVSNEIILEKSKLPFVTISKFIEVPIAISTPISNKLVKQSITNNLIFVGVILKKQGLGLIIESLPKIIKAIPKIRLTIIGDGDYLEELKRLSKKYKVQKYVDFKGFIGEHSTIIEMMKDADLGLATYLPEENNFTYWADPTKIKVYISQGLPVVTTEVPPISKLIKKHDAGIVVDDNPNILAEEIIGTLKNKKRFLRMSRNALDLAKNYEAKKIYDYALK